MFKNSFFPITPDEEKYTNARIIWTLVSLFHDYGYLYKSIKYLNKYNPSKIHVSLKLMISIINTYIRSYIEEVLTDLS